MLYLFYSILGFLTSLGGVVKDAKTNEPIHGVQVRVVQNNQSAYTDSTGKFFITETPNEEFTIELSHLGYKTISYQVKTNQEINILMVPDELQLEEVVISSVRGSESAPVSQKTLSQEEIEKNYFGQEMPYMLTKTPSVITYSDGGNYSGYSYFRIRGIDQTRINFTLNGVPLNEAEDQGVYFSNFPDFANSLQSMQVQRGVGTSTFGTASYGGSINYESVSLTDTNTSADLQLSYGSFNARRIAAECKTGIFKGKYSFYARYSNLSSDGYRHHSGTSGNSAFISGAYFGNKSIFKITAFSGSVKNDMSYLAASATDIVRDPRTNYLSPSEKDEFHQDFVQALHSTYFKNWKLTTSLYYIGLQGNYDVLFTPDMYNYSLNSITGGGYVNASYEKGNWKFISGVNASSYRRNHIAGIKPFQENRLYRNSGNKKELSAYSKIIYQYKKIELFADLQERLVHYNYLADNNYNLNVQPIDWAFFNLKAGFSYKASKALTLYTSLGRTGREPTRNDMFAGFDDIDTSNFALIGNLTKVKPEYVTDWEAGTYFKTKKVYIQANLYWMQFTNEIAAIGQLSYIGLPLRKNVLSSYRKGIEIDARWNILPSLTFTQMLTLSKNKIKEYTSDIDSISIVYKNITPLLTPSVISQSSIIWKYKRFEIEGSGRYVNKSYLDNTNNNNFILPSYLVFNARLSTSIGKNTLISLMVNNISNKKYYTAGYVQNRESYYFIQSPRSYFLTVKYYI